jgi:hypothetical protein
MTCSIARKEKTTVPALTEEGLRLLLKNKKDKSTKWKWKLVAVKGRGLTDEFKNASWDQIRDCS